MKHKQNNSISLIVVMIWAAAIMVLLGTVGPPSCVFHTKEQGEGK